MLPLSVVLNILVVGVKFTETSIVLTKNALQSIITAIRVTTLVTLMEATPLPYS